MFWTYFADININFCKNQFIWFWLFCYAPQLSRMLAAKAALAIRVDALSETSDSTLGLEQRAKLENRVRNLDEKAVSSVYL